MSEVHQDMDANEILLLQAVYCRQSQSFQLQK